MKKRFPPTLAVPLLGALLLLGALAFRGAAGSPPAAKPKPPPAPVRVTAVRETSRTPGPVAADVPVDVAVEDARIRSTYVNYRTAVATGNRALQDALRPVLLRDTDRNVATRMAERDLSTAVTELDRDIAARTLQSLRR